MRFATILVLVSLSFNARADESINLVRTPVLGAQASMIASVLLGGRLGRLSMISMAAMIPSRIRIADLQCEYRTVLAPVKNEVIQAASCKLAGSNISPGLALSVVLALRNAGVQDTGNTGPSAPKPWTALLDVRSIECLGLEGTNGEAVAPSCNVTMGPRSGS